LTTGRRRPSAAVVTRPHTYEHMSGYAWRSQRLSRPTRSGRESRSRAVPCSRGTAGGTEIWKRAVVRVRPGRQAATLESGHAPVRTRS
jgi:hypothetical protein